MSKCVKNASAMNPCQSRDYKSVIFATKSVVFDRILYIIYIEFDGNRGHFAKIYMKSECIFLFYFKALYFESVGRPFESGRAYQKNK